VGMRVSAEMEAKLLALAGQAASRPHALGIDLPPLSEKEFQAEVRRLAKRHGWRHFHTASSKRSEPGLPDSVMVRPPRVVFAELKVPPNKPTAEQLNWLDDLKQCPGVEAYLWGPADLPEIERILT
jgi:hypothetical protein